MTPTKEYRFCALEGCVSVCFCACVYGCCEHEALLTYSYRLEPQVQVCGFIVSIKLWVYLTVALCLIFFCPFHHSTQVF